MVLSFNLFFGVADQTAAVQTHKNQKKKRNMMRKKKEKKIGKYAS